MSRGYLKQLLSIILCVVTVLSSMPMLPVEVHAEGTGVATVTNEAEFAAVLQDASIRVIQLANDIVLSRSADGNDNVFVIPRAVTITGGSLSLERAGIILGGNVTFDSVSINFNTSVRNAIIANGYALTLNNVSANGTFNVDVFCGGIGNYTGGNVAEIPVTGVSACVTITNSNLLGKGGNIYAGNLSDVGNGAPDTSTIYDGSAIINIGVNTAIGKIYAHGARENRSGGYANDWISNASLYPVTGGVSVNLNTVSNIVVDGATGGIQNAVFTYTDNGTGNLCEPNLVNVGSISLVGTGANLAPHITGAVNSISVPSGTKLNLKNTNGVLTTQDFAGGGVVIFPQDTDIAKLTITSSVSGNTQIASGEVGVDGISSTNSFLMNHNYVSYAGAQNENYSFSLLQYTSGADCVLECDGAGNWTTNYAENAVVINGMEAIQVEPIPVNEAGQIEIPIVVDYATQNTNSNSLMYVPVVIKVNDEELLYDEENVSYITGETNKDIALFFNISTSGEEEVLYIQNYDFNYNIPAGEYKIDITIPAQYMEYGSAYTTSFTLEVICEHETIQPDGTCQECGAVAAVASVSVDGANPIFYRTNEEFVEADIVNNYSENDITVNLFADVNYEYTFSRLMAGNWVLNLNGHTMTAINTKGVSSFFFSNQFSINGPGEINGERKAVTIGDGILNIGGTEAPVLTTIGLNNVNDCCVKVNTSLQEGQYKIEIQNSITTAKPVVEMYTPAFIKAGENVALSMDWFVFNHSERSYCGEFELNSEGICYHVTGSEHNWDDGKCKTCEYDCRHNYINGVCNICEKLCSHEWDSTEGFCNECGMECSHTGDVQDCGGHICDTCGYRYDKDGTGEHIDADNGGRCDVCWGFVFKWINAGDRITDNYGEGRCYAFTPEKSGHYYLKVSADREDISVGIYGDSLLENMLFFHDFRDSSILEFEYIQGRTYYIVMECFDDIRFTLSLSCVEHDFSAEMVAPGIIEQTCNICDESITVSISGDSMYTDENGCWFGRDSYATIHSPSGYEISTDSNGAYEAILDLNEGSSKVIYIRESNGVEPVEMDLSAFLKWDNIPPVAVIEIADTYSWAHTFQDVMNLFFKDEEPSMTITGSNDDETGIKEIQYFISDRDILEGVSFGEEAQAIESVVNGAWTKYDDTVTLPIGGKYVVYAKISDHVGNVSYSNTESLVVFTDSKIHQEDASRVYKSDETVRIRYTSNGNTIHSITYNEVALTSDDYIVDAANSEIIFTDKCLDRLSVGQHNLIVAFNPLGIEETDISLTGDIYLTITEADINDAEVEVNASWDYNGAPITPEPIVTYNGTVLVKDVDYTVSYSNNICVGAASMLITGQGNFTGTLTYGFTIVDTLVPSLRIDVEGNIWTDIIDWLIFGHFYKDGVDVTVTADGTGSEVTKVEYLIAAESYANASLPTEGWVAVEKNADNAYVFTVAAQNKGAVYVCVTDGGGNHAVVNSEGIVVYTDSVLETTEIIYTKTSLSAKTIEFDAKGNNVNAVSVDGATLSADNYEVADGKVILSGIYLDSLEVGSHTIVITINPMGETFVENTNTTDVPAVLTVALLVGKADGAVSIVSDLTKVYDGEVVTAPEYTKNSTGTAIIEYKEKAASDDTYTTVAPQNAGKYMVRIRVAEDATYMACVATREFEIIRRELSVVGVTALSKEYDGTKDIKVTEVTVSGVMENDEIVLSVSDGTATVASANAGNYTEVILGDLSTVITLAGTDKDNYKINDTAGIEIAADVTIRRRPVTVKAEDKSKLYGNMDPEFTYAASNLVTEDTLVGELSREEGTDVGSYDITQGTLTNENNSNYDITFKKGILTIKKAPHIQNEEGRMGWDVIREEVKDAKAGDTVTVDMNGSTEIAGSIIDEIKGKDITLIFDMGNGITWSVNGKSVMSDNVADIDMSVTVSTESNPIKNIPMKVINEVTGDNYHLEISLVHNGEFGFEAVLTMNLKAENAGLFANLYYYNPQTGNLEFMSEDEIAEDGTAELTFTHASDYTIVIKQVADKEDDIPYIGFIESPKTGQLDIWFIWIVSIVACGYWLSKKKYIK